MLIHRAKKFAVYWHSGQKRKYTGNPYIVHPARVANIVSLVTNDEAMIAAAWLHDVVEDTPVEIEWIYTSFGTRVGQLVEDLTDISKPSDGNRSIRKVIDRDHTANASADAQTVKLADLIDNSQSILAHDPNFAVVYMKEKKALLEVLTKGNPMLYIIASKIIERYYKEQA